MTLRGAFAVFLFVLLAVLSDAAPACAQGRDRSAAVQTQLQHGMYPPAVQSVYQQRRFEPVWFVAERPSPAARVLVSTLRDAGTHGLDPEAYAPDALDALSRASSPVPGATAARLDVQLTDAFLRYARHMLQGRVDPRALHPGWTLDARRRDPTAFLRDSPDAERMRRFLRALAPPHPGYRRLQAVHARYRQIADAGGWPILAEGPPLAQGDSGERVRQLRTRLHATRDLAAAPEAADTTFGAGLHRAVASFQRRHGLAVDGVVGPRTRAALNVPAQERLRQITLNMERWRWLPEHLGSPHLRVNVAGFELQAVEEQRVALDMRAIVGARGTPTPVFSSEITEVVIAPYWYVPRSIADAEIWPKVARDSSYLARRGMTVLSNGTIRQDPGPANPLGRVKLIPPNPFAIRLHDTPERHLFSEPTCAFSHGCIRLEKLMALAAYVLSGNPAWPRERIEAAAEAWRQTPIPVAEPVPLYVLYRTAWVEKRAGAAGPVVHFRADLYGHDARLAKLLRRSD